MPCEGTLTLDGVPLENVIVRAANAQVCCQGVTDDLGRFKMRTGQGAITYEGVPPCHTFHIQFENALDPMPVPWRSGEITLEVPEQGISGAKIELFTASDGTCMGRVSYPNDEPRPWFGMISN